MGTGKDMSLDQLIELTKGFIKLADELYADGKISPEEYDELTFVKKDFLKKAEKEKEDEIKRCM